MPYTNRKVTTLTGIAIVVANMVGTGAFTSLGFQLEDLKNSEVILTLWLLGGVLSLFGAFSYAEVGTAMKSSGGEYAFLTRLYNPFLGYLSGWISITVGFAAPIALSAIACVEYLPIEDSNARFLAVAIIALVTLIHTRSLRISSAFQNGSTFLKGLLIVTLIIIGLVMPEKGAQRDYVTTKFLDEAASPAFFVALVYVSYSYSGWNAAAYISDEFKSSNRSLPIALIGGTVIVTVLYTLLQYSFLKHASYQELSGQLEVGSIVTQKLLGRKIGSAFDVGIALLLISGISAMVWVGSRVTATMGRDYTFWQHFQPGLNGIPVKALWLQFVIAAIMILTGTFQEILVYCGLLLTFSTMLVVAAVFKLRRDKSHNLSTTFKSPLFPAVQVLFIIFSLAMIGFSIIQHKSEIFFGLLNLMIGAITFFLIKKKKLNKTIQ
jgi:APA family basic amino acid/polyamine antiporter